MRAACRGRDQVHVGFAKHAALVGPADDPLRTLAIGKGIAVGLGKLLTLEERNPQLDARQCFGQVPRQPALVLPDLGIARLFDGQADLDPGHQDGLAAQKVCQFRNRDRRTIEKLVVGPDAHPGAGLAPRQFGSQDDRLDDVTVGKGHPVSWGSILPSL